MLIKNNQKLILIIFLSRIYYMDSKFLIIILILVTLYLIINKRSNRDFFENVNDQMIPKIIIQTWKTKKIPEKYVDDYNSVKKYQKDYQFLFFDDNDIHEFLKTNYPEYYDTYNKLPIIIQKIDFFRYVAVYHYGGFYFDLDMTSFHPLDELLHYKSIFPVDQFVTPEKCESNFPHHDRLNEYCIHDMPFLLGQYAFGSRKKDPFVKALIDGIHNNIDNYIQIYNQIKILNNNEEPLDYVYKTTGPDYVTNVYMRYNDKKDVLILDWTDGQYFGKYAKHNYFGTWKNGQSG